MRKPSVKELHTAKPLLIMQCAYHSKIWLRKGLASGIIPPLPINNQLHSQVVALRLCTIHCRHWQRGWTVATGTQCEGRRRRLESVRKLHRLCRSTYHRCSPTHVLSSSLPPLHLLIPCVRSRLKCIILLFPPIESSCYFPCSRCFVLLYPMR